MQAEYLLVVPHYKVTAHGSSHFYSVGQDTPEIRTPLHSARDSVQGLNTVYKTTPEIMTPPPLIRTR